MMAPTTVLNRQIPPEPPPSNSWPSSKIAAVTVGIILGLTILALSTFLLYKLLQKLVKNWIADALYQDRRLHCDCCRCGRRRAHFGPWLYCSCSTLSEGTPTRPPSPPPLPAPQFPAAPFPREPRYHPRQDVAETVKDFEPRSPREPTSRRQSWEAGNERVDYRAPYVTSVPPSSPVRGRRSREQSRRGAVS